jgi:hypothetical protein
LGSTDLANPGLAGEIPDGLLGILRTLWRGRLLALADYLHRALGCDLPVAWEPDFTGDVMADDIKIHENPDGPDYVMKGGADGGWFFAKNQADRAFNPENMQKTY